VDTEITRWPIDGSASVRRGPLWYSLKIAERWQTHPDLGNERYREREGWPNWEVLPSSPWNYGLELDGHVVFEIGSVTKVVTALVLARLANQDVVSLDDPVDRWVPEAVPNRGPVPSLRSLATHTSGLPRVGKGLLGRALWSTNDPYVRTTFDDVVRAVRRSDLAPGSVAYSHLGYAVLGGALANAAGRPYPELAREAVLEPLGLHDTTFGVPDRLERRVAQGHGGRRRRRVPPWNLGAFTPSGGLRATASDLLALGQSHLTPWRTPVGDAIRAVLAEPLGWRMGDARSPSLRWHEGSTGGFAAFVGVDPECRSAVVAVANTATVPGTPLEDAGSALLAELRGQ
jgi:CubicO group peptidase (beta-lactamase class C family)